MRLFPRLDYGTRQYPEKIARRLRAMNLAAWIAAALAGFFAARRLTDPAADKLLPGLLNLAGAVGFAALPVLHRFGPLVAPGVFVVCAFAFVFWVIARGGTDGGAWLNYLAAVPLVVLLFGAERLILSAVIAAIAAILIIVAHLTFPANTGYVSETSLFYGNFVTNVVVAMALLFAVVHYALRQVTEAEAAAEREHARSEHLLLNILPPRVAERLKEGRENVIADSYEATSVLFADMAGFTRRAGDMTPEQLVQFLNRVFLAFDELVERHGLEKIKTTGDSYMVVSGLPVERSDHAQALAELALAMVVTAEAMVDPSGQGVPIRVGIASGPVVAGVVGTKKFFYDVWGDTVNLAARMESTGEPGRIQVTRRTRDLLAAEYSLARRRGNVEVKGKGPMATWFLLGRRQEAATTIA